jgi:hypothetical protein
MPLRQTRARKNEGLRQFIPMLYERPALKFLKCGEPWEDLADVIFGPPTSRPDRALLVRLKELWFELRVDILAAHRYQRKHRAS